MNAVDVMTSDPAWCLRSDTVQRAAELMRDGDCGEIPVVDDESALTPVGVITDRDIVVRAIAEGRNPLDIEVSDCMTSPAIVVGEDTDLDECLELMQENQIRRLPVVDREGRLTGIVAQADIAEIASPEETGELLREVSEPRSAGDATH